MFKMFALKDLLLLKISCEKSATELFCIIVYISVFIQNALEKTCYYFFFVAMSNWFY